MAKKELFIHKETWNTRFGQSERAVVRDQNGKFVDNASKRQLDNGKRDFPYEIVK